MLQPEAMSDDGFEDEPLDPRVQEELEKLNNSAEELNTLEMQFIETRKKLKATHDSATKKLQVFEKNKSNRVRPISQKFNSSVTYGPTDRRTDGRTDGHTLL